MKRIIALLFACVIIHGSAFAGETGWIHYNKMVDLSHLVEAKMPVDPALKLPELKFFGTIKGGGLHNLEVISYCPHTGTHMDSPYHVIDDAGAIESWPADILVGPALIVSVGKPGPYEITKQDIANWEKANEAIRPGDAVLFHTGHDANWSKGYDAYIKNGYTSLSPEAAQYLVDKKVRYMAVESISPDTDSTEAHKILMRNGIPVVENICNLGAVGQNRCNTIGTFPAVKGGTGVWVRIIAVI